MNTFKYTSVCSRGVPGFCKTVLRFFIAPTCHHFPDLMTFWTYRMASLLTSSSFSTMSRTLSANQMVSSSFSSTPKTFAIMGIWLRFAFRSPRSILLYIGVSISNATQRWRWKSPCSSLSCFIFCPNTFIFSFFYEPLCRFLRTFLRTYAIFYEPLPFFYELFYESSECCFVRI